VSVGNFHTSALTLSNSFSGTEEGYKAAEGAIRGAQEGCRAGESQSQRSRKRACASRFRERPARARSRSCSHDVWCRSSRYGVHITFFFSLCGVLPFYNLLLSGRGTKRKFAFDSTAAEKVAQEAEEAASRQIEREQAAALRSKLPDFWLPSLTPTYTSSGPPSSLADIKLRTTCRGGNPPHPIA
jgi:hypothetical protein